ncbi:MAG: c-type cytochrome [Magnetococcales bacterium]|nr:c-type cytochrome [Magnetococcales bacterium]
MSDEFRSRQPLWSALGVALLLLVASRQELRAEDRHEEGRKIYNFRCYFCHGYSGDARTLATTYLNPKPRNFVTTDPDTLPLERMIASIDQGVPHTAMMGFVTILTPAEIASVAGFVREEFMIRKAENTRYHTPANGWENHERYAEAFPFARGEIPMDRPEESLTAEERRGKRIYLNACISCHDWGRVEKDEPVWESRAVSYPRAGFTPGEEPKVDAVSGASVYARHDKAPSLPPKISETVRLGESLFQKNCAFCHAADGTGKNWIGQFLEPHPRNLTDDAFMQGQTRRSLTQVITSGLEGSSMPAWKEILSSEQISAIVDYIDAAFHRVTPDTP